MPKNISRQKRNYWLRGMINTLPDSIDKDRSSNVVKLFKIISYQIVKARFAAERVETWRDIELARGKALDKIGQQYGVVRGNNDDEFYRFLIKFKEFQNRTDGSYNSIISVIAYALNADPKDISVSAFSNEPQAIIVDNIPNKYIDTDDKTRMIIKQIENSVAAGIKIAGIHFTDQTNLTVYLSFYAGSFTQYVIPAHEDVTVSHYDLTMDSYPAVYGQKFQRYKVATAEDVNVYQHDTTISAYVGQAVSHFKKYTINGKE